MIMKADPERDKHLLIIRICRTRGCLGICPAFDSCKVHNGKLSTMSCLTTIENQARKG